MDIFEFLACFRPFELFSECLGYELKLEFLMDCKSMLNDDWENEYFEEQERWQIFYDEIKRRGLQEKYISFKNYVGENMLYGTE